ncbi:MAG TPA: lysylphosphatidylglycerol synthase transmembrane domain-containing protein [Anaerolineales bacterium]|nr:lysylphosphatidylglycerol synthase transmembrane domain-containing protein [Anaerolineales bacterium]
MQKFILAVVLLLGVTFVFLYFSELQQIIATLQRANPWYLAIALIIQAMWFVVVGLVYQSIYSLLGLKESRRHMMLLAVAANFVNVVTTSAGVGGMALFINDGQRRGQSSGRVTVAGALYLLIDESAFLCVLAVGTIILARRNRLSYGDIAASLTLLAIACAIALFLYLGYRSARTLGNVLAGLARTINFMVRPFLHRDYLSERRAHTFASEIAEGLSALPKKPASLIAPLLLSLLGKILLMGVLTCAFLSFNIPFRVGTIIGGFSIAFLFLIVSPTPSGVGVVEGVMALALHSPRVGWGSAILITLAYRGVTFWLPLLVGVWAFRMINSNKVKVKAEERTGEPL